MSCIYLDYNATTPVDQAVFEAMQPYFCQHFGNPSSSHVYGNQAKKAADMSRSQVAALLNCQAQEILFTSGGSEANNLALIGIAEAYRTKGNHIITSMIEHPAITEVCAHLEKRGFTVTYLPVDSGGVIDFQAMTNAVTNKTILISIMLANNEIGTIQPLKAIAAFAHERGIFVHTDAAQAVGKIPIDLQEMGVDLLSIAGHKFYAPKGIGALYIRPGIDIEKQIHGANHEFNLRAGTENVPGIVGLGKACELAGSNILEEQARLKSLRDQLKDGLSKIDVATRINGHSDWCLPNTLSISFSGLMAADIMSHLPDVAISAGSACHSGSVKASRVLAAIGVPDEFIHGTLRISVGRMTKNEEVISAIDKIKEAVKKLHC